MWLRLSGRVSVWPSECPKLNPEHLQLKGWYSDMGVFYLLESLCTLNSQYWLWWANSLILYNAATCVCVSPGTELPLRNISTTTSFWGFRWPQHQSLYGIKGCYGEKSFGKGPKRSTYEAMYLEHDLILSQTTLGNNFPLVCFCLLLVFCFLAYHLA